jgi:rod shape-determining protein MreC
VSSEVSSRGSKERAALVLLPLLLLQLILLSLQIQGPSGTVLFKTWALAAQAPIIAISSRIAGSVRHAWSSYIWMVGARSENEQLRENVHRLSLLNSTYEQALQENIRLHRLLSMNESIGFRSIGAKVIARAPSFLSNVIYIDRGSEEGVRVDAPVVSGDGVIGRTVIVAGHQSQVQLITSEDASVGAMVEPTRTPGVIRGTGDNLLDLNYISNTEQIAAGDIIITSGLDGIYPKGFVIGKVVQLQKGKDVFRSIRVEPSMDLIHIEEVLVLHGESKQEKRPAPGK